MAPGVTTMQMTRKAPTVCMAATVQAASTWFAQHDVRVYAADAQGANVDGLVPAPRVALIVGNEGAGLSADVRALADGEREHGASVPSGQGAAYSLVRSYLLAWADQARASE